MNDPREERTPRRILRTLILGLVGSILAGPNSASAQDGRIDDTVKVLTVAVEHVRDSFREGPLWVDLNYERIPSVESQVGTRVAVRIGAGLKGGREVFGCGGGEMCSKSSTVLVLPPPSVKGTTATVWVHAFFPGPESEPISLVSTQLELQRVAGTWRVTKVLSKEIG